MDALAAQKSAQDNQSLIGQFGVGFYSAFMVADKLEVRSLKAGEKQAYLWVSDGKGEYSVEQAQKSERGTQITLHLKESALNFLEDYQLESLIKSYSDHVQVPILMPENAKDVSEDEQEAAQDQTQWRQVNAASALWARPKSELNEQDYKNFYSSTSGLYDEPWDWEHFHAEGQLEYSGLLYFPSTKPFNLFEPDRKTQLKLFVRRVFITDSCQELLPAYLRFMRGVVDSADLPLNVSRELLQSSPLLDKMREGITSRVLKNLKKRAKNDAEGYHAFWENFGAVLKEGLYEDAARRADLLELLRVKTSTQEGWQSLAQIKERMQEGQKSLYFITGDDSSALMHSPHLEGYQARGIEVLLLDDHVDSFWTTMISDYEGLSFKSVTKGNEELKDVARQDGQDESKDEVKEGDFAQLIAQINAQLVDHIKQARLSDRLTDSPAVLVADENDLDINLERILKAAGQSIPSSKRILEINPKHPLIKKLQVGQENQADLIELLLDQALIIEGEKPRDRMKFAHLLSLNLV